MRKLWLLLTKDRNLFLLVFTFFILDRIIVLAVFSFNFVGSDDLIFWQAATDYMHGIFHEPYFYGQNYNFMLEAAFAVPFLKIGIPYVYCLPICTVILAVWPFLLFSFLLYKNNFKIEAICFILIPLLLPIEYEILTSVTRGFISGLFFSGFFVFSLLQPTKRKSWLIAALSLSLGYIFNPNSLVFALPVCLYLLLINYKEFSFYVINICIICLVVSIEFFAKQFYLKNPDYNVGGAWILKYDFGSMLYNLKHLDKFFAYSGPVLWPVGWYILLVLLLSGIFLLKTSREKGISLIFAFLFITFSLGINKINDDLKTIFLSSTRMFLGIPLLTGVAFFWSKKIFITRDEYLKRGILVLAISVFCYKAESVRSVVAHHTQKTNYAAVAIKKSDELKCDCEWFDIVSKIHSVDLIIFVPSGQFNVPDMEFYNYGCPLLTNNFPKTMMNIYEKRTWIYLQEKSSVERTILLYNPDLNAVNMNDFKNATILSDNPQIILFKDNKMTTDSLLGLLKIPLRRNTY